MAAPIDAGSIYSDVRIRLDKLNGDIRSVQTSLDKITKASAKTATESKKKMGKFFSFIKKIGVASIVSMAGAFLAASAAIRGTIKLFKDSEDAASDALEVFSKFDTVFESIQEEANKTADELASSFGIAESTARELLSATGDILVGFGFSEEAALSLAKQTTELSADLASFTNFEGGAARASAALTKALVGESESVKALGIVIRQDTKEYKARIESIMETNNVSQIQAKALAALQIATEQSGKAIGDVARTWDSAANTEKRLVEQTKSLKEAIGAGLLPTVTAIRKKLGEWATAVTKVLEESNKLRDAQAALDEGNASREQTVLLLEKQIKVERERLRLSEGNARLTEQGIALIAESVEKTISGLQRQISVQKRLGQAEKEIKQARIDEDKAAEAIGLRKKAVAEAQLLAFEELERRQFALLTPQEQRLQLIQEEINQLVIQRAEARELGVEWQDIQNLINDLYRERIELQKESTEAAKVTIDFTKGLVDEWKEAELERIFEVDAAETEAAEKRAEELRDRIALQFQFANAVVGIFTSLDSLQDAQASAELARLEESGATEEELAQRKKELAIDDAKRNKALGLLSIAVNTASAIIGFLANPGGLAGVGLSIFAGIEGGIQAAAINAQPIPSFATGGIQLPSKDGSIVKVAENGSPELMLNSGQEGQALLGEFADQIVKKMGGGMTLIIQAGDETILQKKIDNWYNNNEVLVDVSTILTGVS